MKRKVFKRAVDSIQLAESLKSLFTIVEQEIVEKKVALPDALAANMRLLKCAINNAAKHLVQSGEESVLAHLATAKKKMGE